MFYPMFSNLRTLYKLFFFPFGIFPNMDSYWKENERRNEGTEGGRERRKGRENNTRTNDSTALDKGYTVLIIKHRFTMNEESSDTIPIFK